MNSRLDELQAAILLKRFSYLPIWTERRRSIADQYRSRIKNDLFSFLDPPICATSHVYHLFVVRCLHRDHVQDKLSQLGVQTLIHYPIPSHQQQALEHCTMDPSGLAETESHCSTCLSLPIHPYLTEDEVDYIISACNSLHD